MIADQMTAVARPYARALLAAAGGKRAEVLASLQGVVEALGSPGVPALVANPRVPQGALASALAPDSVSPVVAQLITVLIQNDRLGALPAIAKAFAALKDEAENRTRATITSALALTEPEVARLQAALMRRTGRSVELTLETDARLLAGVIVQHGDMVLDGSVRGRLAALAHALSPF